MKIVARPSFSLSIAAPIWAALCLATWSWTLGSLAMCGVLAGYLAYEFVHYGVHTLSGGLVWWRRNHFHHHFQEPGRVFGVTSPIWDYVFGTRPRPRSVS
jgi:sterol desaturase/sphingolipid hydroxylase (fatty acid hydroxylase superfamily)